MNHPPCVAAVHDLSGFGRCSLTVVLPVLSALGCRCSPLPTAYLSAHTGFPPSPHSVFFDLSDQMAPTLEHWSELGAGFDAIYSGFLGSARQIAALRQLMARFRRPGTLVLVDPVMGDHGVLYRTYTDEMCTLMGGLVEEADLITPNLTEAARLLGEPYDPQPDGKKVDGWLERLSGGGRRSVVITGVMPQPHQVGAAGLDRNSGERFLCTAPLVEGRFSGTGDLFASVLLGRLLGGSTLEAAADTAVHFTQRCAQATRQLGTDPVQGANFEPFLKELMQ